MLSQGHWSWGISEFFPALVHPSWGRYRNGIFLGVGVISLDHLAGCSGVVNVAFATFILGLLVLFASFIRVNAFGISPSKFSVVL